jgi:FkbM family methyltransferase
MTKTDVNSRLIGRMMDCLQLKNIHLLDIGASGGLFTPFESFLGMNGATIHIIEPSRVHAEKLRIKYSGYKNVLVHEVGLFKESGKFKLNYSDTGGASLYHPDNPVVDKYVDYHASHRPNIICEVEVVAVDKWFESLGITSILIAKLDTQGCELDILEKGADVFSKASSIYTEAPMGHKYIEQFPLSKYFEYFERNDFELFDIVKNYSSLIIGSSREEFSTEQLHLKSNWNSQNSVFRPRIMDGDILCFKKADAVDSQQNIRRLIVAYAAMGYYLEAYDALSKVTVADVDVDDCKNILKALISKNARYHDRYSFWRLAEKVFRRYFANL